MTIIKTAKVTSKGQVTIPNRIRKILHLGDGASVAFGVTNQGIILMPCKIKADSPYTSKEWTKIERLTSIKGKTYRTLKTAKRHIEAL